MWLQITKRVSKKNLADAVDSSKKIKFFQKKILEWFRHNGRSYPWRKEKDPYKILIAEMMLQRTRGDQVLPVYRSFIKKYPSIQSLSDADVGEVSKFVKKLGLFWRSRFMVKMASAITNDHDGRISRRREDLLKIPGIGDYIADAMISFAFGGRRTVIDSNVVRLVSRYFGITVKGEIRRKKEFIDFCQNLSLNLKSNDVKRLNWAMIDHSASLCRPEPCCVKCPLSQRCHYFNKRGLIVRKQ